MSQPPLRISWSAIRTHEECHQKSWLLREGKRAKVNNIRNFFPGTVVDRAMREWLDDPEHPTGGMARIISTVMTDTETEEKGHDNVVRWRNAADRNDVHEFCVTLVNRLEPILREHVLPYEYAHGKWFKVPTTVIDNRTGSSRNVMLTGEMDLLLDNSGPVVWDLKGTADDSYWRKVVAQLTFYDLAVLCSSGTATRFVGLIQPMCKEQLLAFEVTDQARSQMFARITAYANDVWAGENTCRTSTDKCHWCDVRHACARFSPKAIDSLGELGAGLREAAKETP